MNKNLTVDLHLRYNLGSGVFDRKKKLLAECHARESVFSYMIMMMGLCEYVIVHTILGGSPVILWISLGGKPKWLPLNLEP